jgi:uncharacterized membrane protein
MRPLTIITGIVLGSCFSIALGLAVVVIIFLILGVDQPRLAGEFEPLLASLAIFVVMTAISAASFLSLLKSLFWRWPAQVLMWTGLLLTGFYYWPD